MEKIRGLLCIGVTVGLLVSCSSTVRVTDSSEKKVVKPVSCIAVLPVMAGEDEDVARVGGKMENVRMGARHADSVLRSELAGQPDVRFVGSPEDLGNLAGIVRRASEETGCEAVMATSVYKYRQRLGSGMAVDEPASTSFSIRLYEKGSRNILWAADFSETQQSLFSNIFSFGKAQSRGFRWITVEELMTQGLQERLAGCPYLQQVDSAQ